MKVSLPLLRRRPAPAHADPMGTAPERDPGLGTPWAPPEAASQGLPLSATVIERSRGARISESDRVVYQAASLLLDYPDEQLLEDLPVIREAVEQCVHGSTARDLLAVIDHLASSPLYDVQNHYVETFDMRRRCCLHLTYYAYGDTRRRGMALLDLKQTYQACGATLQEDELPDHLSVVLAFAAGIDGAVGRTLLLDHRPGIELLRISLTDRNSVYARVLDAVSSTLPTLEGRDRDAVRSLIASGPPDEQVGMEAYVSDSSPQGMRV